MKRPAVAVAILVLFLLIIIYVIGQLGPYDVTRKITENSPDLASSAAPPQAKVMRPGNVPDVPGANLSQRDKNNIAKIMAAFSARIDFYGKVIDQYGQGVPGAKIHYSAADQYFGNSSKYEGVSAPDGSFSLEGIKGAGLYVSVYQDGYDGLPQSGGSYGYGVPSGNRPPTKENPAIFVLRKKGPTQPLRVISSRQYEISKTGQSVNVNLNNARKVGADEGDIQVETWVIDQAKDEQGRFDWRFRVSAPGGGLIERQDNFVFNAPESEYRTSDEIDMPRSKDRWKRDIERDYFVRLRDNRYAHIKIEMMVGGSYNFFVLESYLNPTPGDRNLEFDPAKQIKVK